MVTTGSPSAPVGPSDGVSSEGGSGLVELLVAAWLGVLALAVLGAVARGPLAAAAALAAPRPDVEGAALLREVLSGAVRTAPSDPRAPALLSAGPTVLVLRADGEDPSAWWRLVIDGDVLRVSRGRGAVTADAGDAGAALVHAPPASHVVVRDASGLEIAGPGVGTLPLGAPELWRAALVEVHVAERGAGRLAVALRIGP